jgi:nucleotide-binding universal stress UspA family protein
MKKILIAYDGSEPAQRALEQAADLATAMGGRVTVVSVVPARSGRVASDPWDDRDVHTAALVEAKTLLAARGIEWDLLEPAGDPAKTIVRIGDEGEFDTIVIGSRGQGRAARVLLGSTSDYVATHAKATVIIVH